MNWEERQLLCCLRAYRAGEKAAQIIESDSPENWRRLYDLSGCHKLTAVVYEMLWNTPGFCGGDPALLAHWKRESILQAVAQAGRTQTLLQLTETLGKAGIRYAVVKGVICRQLYRKSDLRPSGDEDLLILPQERERCGEIFAACGMTAISLQAEEGVDHWQDSRTGLHIELHTRPFSTGWTAEKILNPYFEKQLLHTVPISVEGKTVQTLEPTANLLFLIAHALKHFITGGFGVRTLADILSFCEQYDSQIDRDRLWAMLGQIRGTVFFRRLLKLGRDYLEFDTAPWGCISSEASDEKDLMDDMLQAGVYGQTSMNRKHSAALALQAAQGEQEGPSLRTALFPSAEKLAVRYPVLRRAPALLPAAWLHRMGCYALELLRDRGRGNSPVETLSLGKKRTEMMVKYGILPQGKTEDR